MHQRILGDLLKDTDCWDSPAIVSDSEGCGYGLRISNKLLRDTESAGLEATL